MKLAEILKTIKHRNNLLQWALKDRNVDFKISTVRKVLGYPERKEDPENHLMIVVGNKHMSYHETGYSGGKDGKDTMKNVPLKQALDYLQDG